MKYKWKEYSLCDLIEIKHGFAFKGENITSDDNGIVLVTPGNFAVGGGFQESKCKFFNGVYPNDYVLQPDDLIVTMTDLSKSGDTLGYGALVPKSNRTYLHNQRIGLVSINSEELCKKYLYWFMRSQYYQKSIVASASGSVVKHTSPTRIGEIKISLPPQNIQIEIADTLFALDDRITENKKINHHLEQMAQTIFKSWFVDFEPFGGTMPDDWQHEKLGDICQCVLGGTPSRNKAEYWNGKIPWINSGEINRFRITSPSEYITEQGLNHSSTKMLPAKTVVLAITGATLGQISILEIDSCANQSVVGIIPNDELPYEFIYPFIKDNIQNIISNKTGGAQQHINKQNIESVQLFLPTNQEIIKYNHQVAPIYAAIANNCFENARLAELRDTLLPRLMSGELSVADLKENV